MDQLNQYSLTQTQISLITLIERFQGGFEATKFQRPALVEKLKKSSIITSAGASTRIEGALLNDEQVQELVKKGCRITKLSSRSEREVAGYVKALGYIYENFEKLDLCEKTIRELHQLLTFELTEDQLPSKQRGTYKDITNDVVETDSRTGKILKLWFKTTPPGPETQVAMRNLVSKYKEFSAENILHPLVLIGGFIVHFLAIHPFRDGNGRLSRLLTTFLLLKHNYNWSQYSSHEKVIEDNKESYYTSLRSTQTTFNHKSPKYERWFDFFLKIISLQAEFLKNKLILESPVTVLNANEKNIYQMIKGAGNCKIAYLLENTELTRPGIKSLLRRLLEKNIIQKKGMGKGTVYFVKE